jgi:hypothetical protein
MFYASAARQVNKHTHTQPRTQVLMLCFLTTTDENENNHSCANVEIPSNVPIRIRQHGQHVTSGRTSQLKSELKFNAFRKHSEPSSSHNLNVPRGIQLATTAKMWSSHTTHTCHTYSKQKYPKTCSKSKQSMPNCNHKMIHNFNIHRSPSPHKQIKAYQYAQRTNKPTPSHETNTVHTMWLRRSDNTPDPPNARNEDSQTKQLSRQHCTLPNDSEAMRTDRQPGLDPVHDHR